MTTVHDNPARSRFEMEVDGEVAYVAYQRDGEVLALTHTVVPAAIEGRGVGTALVRGALADVRARGLRIVPQCSFVGAYLERHPEDAELLA